MLEYANIFLVITIVVVLVTTIIYSTITALYIFIILYFKIDSTRIISFILQVRKSKLKEV